MPAQPGAGSGDAVLWCLFFAFGTVPWLVVNAMFVELPVLTGELPEGNQLGALLGGMVQAGNVLPLAYILCRHTVGINEEKCIAGVLVTLVAVGAFAACFVTDTVGGHSVPLLFITIAGGMCGCLSKVLWFPFASKYGDAAISATSTGMGLSGILCVLLTVGQGLANFDPPSNDDGGDGGNASETPAPPSGEQKLNFSVATAFWTVVGICAATTVAFLVILYAPRFRRVRAKVAAATEAKAGYSAPSHPHAHTESEHTPLNSGKSVDAECGPPLSNGAPHDADALPYETRRSFSCASTPERVWAPSLLGTDATVSWRSLILRAWPLVLIAFMNALMNYFIMPGIMPYLTGPKYGPLFWETTVYYVGNMLGRYMPNFRALRTKKLAGLVAALCVVSVYLVAMAAANQSTNGGGFFAALAGDGVWWASVIAVIFVFSMLNGYLATSVNLGDDDADAAGASLTRRERECVLQMIGMANQTGSCIGTYTCLGVSYVL